jgi:hypothetical protein
MAGTDRFELLSVSIVSPWHNCLHSTDDHTQPFARISIFRITLFVLEIAFIAFCSGKSEVARDIGVCII